MARFGKERCSSPLLLAAGAPAATVDEAVYIAPALRCAQSHTPANLETVLMLSVAGMAGCSEHDCAWQCLRSAINSGSIIEAFSIMAMQAGLHGMVPRDWQGLGALVRASST